MDNYYNIDGMGSKSPKEGFWILEWNDQFSINGNDNTTDLDFALINLTHLVSTKLFGSPSNLYSILMTKTIWYSYAGIDAELKISKGDFAKLYEIEKSEETNKLLYYYDFVSIIGSLQNLISESRYLFCEFYKTLNENTFMLHPKPLVENGGMFASGRSVLNIFSKINHLFINLASQLDFITKIAFEFENFPSNFNDYPKLKCANVIFGESKKLKIALENTLFEKSVNTKLILSLRNEIVHNASFENIPKVYQIFKKGELIEKFILIPDSTGGFFHSHRNRKRFFDQDIKLNEILPNIVFDHWEMMMKTIKKIN